MPDLAIDSGDCEFTRVAPRHMALVNFRAAQHAPHVAQGPLAVGTLTGTNSVSSDRTTGRSPRMSGPTTSVISSMGMPVVTEYAL